MARNHPQATQYKEVAVQTATPLQLVVMLYDEAILSLQDAKKHILQNNIEGRAKSLNRTISILSELQSSLNRKEGGEIAGSLDRLYDYMKRSIFKANVEQSIQPVEEIEGLLENLRSAWKQVVDKSPNTSQSDAVQKATDTEVMGLGNPAPMHLKTLNISA